ncbi:MAG: ATP-binding cassette domain-containing protein [Bacteroidetes bacterium]|nr:ATP-binding cassette domain-containing protein [Bacteroidota bacterium]
MSEFQPEILIKDVHKAFGERKILRGVSVSAERGSTLAVMGGSGTGKSVLLKHMIGLMAPDSGEVWIQGKRIDQLRGSKLDKLRLRIGYLFQGGALFDSMTVEENLDFVLGRHTALTAPERTEQIHEAIAWVDLPHAAPQYPAELSGGQRKRIALARAVILRPDILLCDEPTTGLDPVSVRNVSNLIMRLKAERGITTVAITHDLLCAEIIADHAAFIFDGKILAKGTLQELRSSENPQSQEFFG